MRNTQVEGVVRIKGFDRIQVYCKDAPEYLRSIWLTPAQLKGAQMGQTVTLVHNGIDWERAVEL